MRYPEARIQEVTGLTDMCKIALVEHYMREVHFYPWLLNSVDAEAFDNGALVSVEALQRLDWNFV